MKPTAPGEGESPRVSVIMPVRNEAGFIRRSLGAVLQQDYPRSQLEVVVADGMSEDETRSAVEQVVAEHPGAGVTVVPNPSKIFSTGFNLGLARAQGQIIVMMGGHTEVAPDYIRRCVAHLQDGRYACVGGYIDTVAEGAQSRAIAMGMSSSFGVGGVGFRTRPGLEREVDTVAFGAYRRATLEACGPVDEEMTRNQDDELNYRIRKLGYAILQAPDIRCRYHSRSSIGRVCKQYFLYGLWKVRVLQKHPLQMRVRHFIPGLFVGTLLLAAAAAAAWPPARWPAAGFTLLYVGVNIGASVLAAARGGWASLPWLPFVFGALHLSYGSGFLVGLIRFGGRWPEFFRELLRGRRVAVAGGGVA